MICKCSYIVHNSIKFAIEYFGTLTCVLPDTTDVGRGALGLRDHTENMMNNKSKVM